MARRFSGMLRLRFYGGGSIPSETPETFLRLAFLSWYHDHEPGWLTGLETDLPSVDALLTEAGGEEALSGDALFALAILSHLFAPLGADEVHYRSRARSLGLRAAKVEPQSRLFREWRYFLREEADTTAPRIYLREEVHARYHGRGAMGDYIVHTLLGRLAPGSPAASAV